MDICCIYIYIICSIVLGLKKDTSAMQDDVLSFNTVMKALNYCHCVLYVFVTGLLISAVCGPKKVAVMAVVFSYPNLPFIFCNSVS